MFTVYIWGCCTGADESDEWHRGEILAVHGTGGKRKYEVLWKADNATSKLSLSQAVKARESYLDLAAWYVLVTCLLSNWTCIMMMVMTILTTQANDGNACVWQV